MSESTLEFYRPLLETFSLGSWRVEPQLNQLTEIANPCHHRNLEPRLMHLLCYLAANPGRVLTRELLSNELWPRVIVNENSLTRAVSELRKQLTLPDSPGTGYLQTIPKRGYLLIFPPQPAAIPTQGQNLPANRSLPLAATSATVVSWRRPLQLAACLVLAALTISIDYPTDQAGYSEQALSETGGDVFDQVVEQEPVIIGGQLSLSALNSSGVADQSYQLNPSSALSPDGSVMAFVRHEMELSTIYLARNDLDSDPVAVFSTQDFLYNLGWSPIGNALLFARQSPSLLNTLLANPAEHADLVMLDLDTLSLQVLIDNSPEPRRPAAV